MIETCCKESERSSGKDGLSRRAWSDNSFGGWFPAQRWCAVLCLLPLLWSVLPDSAHAVSDGAPIEAPASIAAAPVVEPVVAEVPAAPSRDAVTQADQQHAPEITSPIADVSTMEGVLFRYDFGSAFRDVDRGDSLTFSVTRYDGSPLPAWIGVDAVQGMLSGKPALADTGTIRVKVMAKDRTGATAEAVFTVEVVKSTFSLQAFLRKVIEKNGDIVAQRLEWEAAEHQVMAARGIYEPVLKASVTRESNHVENTIQERLSQRYASEYAEFNNYWNASIEGLTPMGGTYRFGYEGKKLMNSLSEYLEPSYYSDPYTPEYMTFLGVTLAQPLLKGFGPNVTNANIRVARANGDIAYEGFRQTTIETLAKAAQLYWQCYGAQEKLRMRRQSMNIAEKMLKLNRLRYMAGKIPYTDVMEAESGLRLRQALVAAAEQTELTAKRNMLTLISGRSTSMDSFYMRVTDTPDCKRVAVDHEQVFAKARDNYPQYLSARRSVEREALRMNYAKNQRLPQLDIKGSYGMNGLDGSGADSWERAWTKDYLSWNIGVELTLPILGDIKSDNDYLVARLRKRQAEARLGQTEADMLNQMEIVAGLVDRVYNQVQNYDRIAMLNAELLRSAQLRFKLGKTDIRSVFDKEEDHLKVRESLLDSKLAYQYAVVNLYALDGSLMERNDVAMPTKDALLPE